MRQRKRSLGRALASAAALLLATIAADAAKAATIPVSTLVDEEQAANGNCTLREALLAAQSDAAVDACPAGEAGVADVVALVAGVHGWSQGMLLLGDVGGAIVLRGPAAEPPTAVIDIDASTSGRFALLLNGADLTIENVELTGGDASADQSFQGGGALAVLEVEQVALTLRNVVLAGNRGRWGGGLYFETTSDATDATLRIERTVVRQNVAAIQGVAGGPRGGGIMLQLRGATTATIVDTRFESNDAASSFAGDTGLGGGLYAGSSDSSVLRLSEVTFVDNSAAAGAGVSPNGGGAYLSPGGSSLLRLEGAVFTGNHLISPFSTGGQHPASALHLVSSFDGVFRLDRLRLVGNDPGSPGVELRIWHLSPQPSSARNILVAGGTERGAQVGNLTGPLELAHFTVTGHAVEELRLERGGEGELRLDNSILFGAGESLVPSGGPSVDPSNLIDVEPLFVDAAAGDYHLAPLSPAIDFGDATLASTGFVDLDHAARVAGADTDAGAYEHDALFADDFESGGSSAWSRRAP